VGILVDKVEEAFRAYAKNGDICKFALRMVDIGDHSIQNERNRMIVDEAILKCCKERR